MKRRAMDLVDALFVALLVALATGVLSFVFHAVDFVRRIWR